MPPPRLALLILLAACATPPLQWPGRQRGLDPEPSGPPYLRAYKESHFRALGTDFVGHLSEPAFEAELRRSRVLFLGDHHPDRVLHRRMLSQIRRLIAAGLRPILGLEAVGVEDRFVLDEYLHGRIGMQELRRDIRSRWPDSWLDNDRVDRVFYRALLRLARDEKLPVFGLEPTPRLDLSRRDAVIARSIDRVAATDPDHLVVVIVGHAHLLGQGGLVRRVALPNVAVGARMSTILAKRFSRLETPPDASFLVSSSGVLFALTSPASTGAVSSPTPAASVAGHPARPPDRPRQGWEN